MANAEQLQILRQGSEKWNSWRKEHRDIQIDLTGVDLDGIILKEVNLSRANLSRADLSNAGISSSYLDGAILKRAEIIASDLSGAILKGADLSGAIFLGTNLSRADLSEASLFKTNLSLVTLDQTDFTESILSFTVFDFSDLSQAKNLSTCQYDGPSTIGYESLIKSRNLPLPFLRGVGLSDEYIESLRVLTLQPIEFYTCFISHTEKDKEFTQKLYNDLQGAGIRCWYWWKDLAVGHRMTKGIDEAIRIYDKLIVILSKSSLKSQPVLDEITRAFQKERQVRKKDPNAEVLYPVTIDKYIFSHHCNYHHKADLIAKRIGNFTDWKNHDSYKEAFQLLVKALKKTHEEKKKNPKPKKTDLSN